MKKEILTLFSLQCLYLVLLICQSFTFTIENIIAILTPIPVLFMKARFLYYIYMEPER